MIKRRRVTQPKPQRPVRSAKPATPTTPPIPRLTLLLDEAAKELHLEARTLRMHLRDDPCLIRLGKKSLVDRLGFVDWCKRHGIRSAARLLAR